MNEIETSVPGLVLRELTAADVDAVFKALTTSSQARDKLQHYYSRIGKYYSADQAAAAHALLGELCTSQEAVSRKRLFQRYEQVCVEAGQAAPDHERRRLFNLLMHDLENDFYVDEVDEDRYDFASGVMKSWWRKYHA